MSVEVKGPGNGEGLPGEVGATPPADAEEPGARISGGGREPCPSVMGAEEMIALTRKHTMFSWVAQHAAEPIAMETAEGVYFCSADGKRYLDFNSQAMSVNIGHGNEQVVDAIAAQARKLAYAYPHAAHEPRARLGARLAALTPGDLDVMFFTTGGAVANDMAIKLARQYTGRQKIMARYRSYHGATGQAMVATGDPRRWANEVGAAAIVRVPDAHRYGRPEPEPVERSLEDLEEVIMFEGAHTIAGFLLEPVVGANGILIPPDGYMQGVREICDKHGILLIADEVMSGFGRTGKWFAVEHWGVVPDLITMGKGITSSYIPFGAVAMRQRIADAFNDEPFFGGLTYHSHPIGCAAALAVIDVYDHDGLIDRAARMGEVMREHHVRLAAKHPSVGTHRNIGLFGILELVRDRETFEPMAPYNGSSPEMAAIQDYMRDHGLFALTRWNTIHTNPPLIITEEEMAEAFEVIDGALYIADEGTRS
jgi:taurine--2-oxoglutarate transaminase